jgi:hypothetical protein
MRERDVRKIEKRRAWVSRELPIILMLDGEIVHCLDGYATTETGEHTAATSQPEDDCLAELAVRGPMRLAEQFVFASISV